ncbi:hypothetical protein G6L37_07395 [Agrobacterium rubi]|nr:hypothetical protein [Agrobacterium rubi]NTF25192.1 hypothetical protein [Agrobacterium rubi]
MDSATQPSTAMELKLSEALMRIGEELGLSEVSAFNCVNAIRRLKSAPSAPPQQAEVPLLDWKMGNGDYVAECTAGEYLVYVQDGQPVWGIVNVSGPIPVDSVEAALSESQRDFAARLQGAAAYPVRSLNWIERENSSWTTSRVVRYRVCQITHREGKGQWMIELNGYAITTELFPTREAAKAFVQDHWARDQQILYTVSESRKAYPRPLLDTQRKNS